MHFLGWLFRDLSKGVHRVLIRHFCSFLIKVQCVHACDYPKLSILEHIHSGTGAAKLILHVYLHVHFFVFVLYSFMLHACFLFIWYLKHILYSEMLDFQVWPNLDLIFLWALMFIPAFGDVLSENQQVVSYTCTCIKYAFHGTSVHFSSGGWRKVPYYSIMESHMLSYENYSHPAIMHMYKDLWYGTWHTI